MIHAEINSLPLYLASSAIGRIQHGSQHEEVVACLMVTKQSVVTETDKRRSRLLAVAVQTSTSLTPTCQSAIVSAGT